MTTLSTAVLTGHARQQLARRNIDEADVRAVLAAPDHVETVRPGRVVAQKRLSLEAPPRDYLLRVFVDIDRDPAAIVTAYRTSRLARYRSQP
jgi:hypothetical protein